MKTSIVILGAICLGLAGVAVGYLARPATAPTSAVETAPPQATERQAEPSASQPELAHALPEQKRSPATTPIPNPAANEQLNGAAPAGDELKQAVDTLTSAQASFLEKRSIWKQLQEAGKLDATIDELKKRAGADPKDPGVHTALGEAQLFKLMTVEDYTERGLLALQADQSFSSALKLDPSNWESQFYKASSMSHWPPELHKDQEVIQRLSSLIDQQEATTAQPQFARTYLTLGEVYERLGQPDFAQQTWKLGATKFPGDPALQAKLNGQAGR